MSVHRYRTASPSDLDDLVPSIVSVSPPSGFLEIDVDLGDDSFKDDLDVALATCSYVFQETAPTTPRVSFVRQTVVPTVAGMTVSRGDAIALVDASGAVRAMRANAVTGAAVEANCIGFAAHDAATLTPLDVIVAGENTTPVWDTPPTAADAGKLVFLDTTAGRVTLTAPTGAGEGVLKVGVVSAGPSLVIQIGDKSVI